ncbi:uncharacterized protein IL334_006803 [Kwoniella shivajii]|uniref:Golgi apparatus membrane protein TVP38 n=1 Tax=Kwoniella shivajii TaxID=564305 RepID=A0ABZ1D880_9TREE|nr:hypothetical protein IL334_006803 [Kwoniella shivajii]
MSNYTPPLPPVMSRENSSEDMHQQHRSHSIDSEDMVGQSSSLDAGPSRLSSSSASTITNMLQPPKNGSNGGGRRASKSISGTRPAVIVTPAAFKRTQSYYTPQIKAAKAFPSSPIPSSPELNPNIVKRRTSIPSLVRRYTAREEDGIEELPNEDFLEPSSANSIGKGKGKMIESRARSTSTSVVIPQTQNLTENSTYTFPSQPPSSASIPETSYTHSPEIPSASQSWSAMPLSPPSSDRHLSSPSEPTSSFLASAYNAGESSIARLLGWVRPKRHRYDGMAYRRGSDDNSEKGLNGSEEEQDDDDEGEQTGVGGSMRRPGKYWGVWGSGEDQFEESSSLGYFSLPPTPPLEGEEQFSQAALPPYQNTLPTPALSSKSLSRDNSKRSNKLKKVFRKRTSTSRDQSTHNGSHGWLTTSLYNMWSGLGSGKTAEVVRELGWTVGLLVGTFFVTAAIVLWLIQSMPITTLKHIPKSTTDLQVLSAEIKSYMAASDAGWWHTIGVLTFVGCWKHAWSVPGAVVLNILVGSLLDPMPALALLTIITATGSLGAYSLSRPLAPLIAVLFPKPLALVRAALAPDSTPAPATAHQYVDETITPVQTSSDPTVSPIGGPTDKSVVWRRLLTMRAMGFVPWSGMNVACGVVGVDWKIFWVTTAAGSASWSYVTASVGHILSRLKVPTGALVNSGVLGDGSTITNEEIINGESLTSLLRDPILIAKLIFLSAITLLPVILKRRNGPSSSSSEVNPDLNVENTDSASTPRTSSSSSSFELNDMPRKPQHPTVSTLRLDLDGISNPPMSPLSQSLAQFTPTPRVFDLFSIGRTIIRTGQRGLNGGIRGAERIVRGSTT